ncbi:MAG: hypothetical protein EPO68_05190 [Planctomycetota bacterium]|nr:MAG: hypothetical protein EPO68_05190 [Planctomycetota bacterium]
MLPPIALLLALATQVPYAENNVALLQDPAPQADPPPPRPSPFEGGLEAMEPRGLRLTAPGVTPGYLLVNPLNSKSVHLVDLGANPVHTWKTEYLPGGVCRLLDNGHLLRMGQEPNNPRFHGGGIGGRLQELDWDGKVVWEYVLATDRTTLHHDVDVLPNGNLLCIAWEYRSPDEALAAGRDAHAVNPEGLWPDTVFELKKNASGGGEIVWQWHAWDHLMQDRSPQKPNYAAKADLAGRIDINADHRFKAKEESDEERLKREDEEAKMRAVGYAGGAAPTDAPGAPPKPKPKYEADWLHTNAVDYNAALDLIVLSTPHMGEIWVIDHSTTTAQAATSSGGKRGKGGDLLYRWGNPRNFGRGTADDHVLHYQHNPTWIVDGSQGAPRVLLFNNGMHRAGDFSEVYELELPFTKELGFELPKRGGFGPVGPAWQYSDPPLFFSPFISGAQRLANGNTVVCSGAAGRVFELTSDGKVVWDWRNTLGGDEKPSEQGGKAPPHALFRAEKYAANSPALAKLKK